MSAGLAPALLAWFDAGERDVPWRGEDDPWRILVAEVMAQQTRLETVRSYYAPFLERFPHAPALAAAPEDEVLKAWEGLGYYQRARRLRAAAGQILERHGGRVPDTVEGLRSLPGIGPYTAGAVASLAFGRPEPAVDGNARRVLSRLFDLEGPGQACVEGAARRLLDEVPGRAAELNQAIMDLGSEVCTPRAPRCGTCPVEAGCLARERDTVPDRPGRTRRPPRPERERLGAVVRRGGRVLVWRRPPEGLLGALWDLPSIPRPDGRPPAAALAEGLEARLGIRVHVGAPLRSIRHDFSHFRLRLEVYGARWRRGEPRIETPWRWAEPAEIDELAFPAYHRAWIGALQSSNEGTS